MTYQKIFGRAHSATECQSCNSSEVGLFKLSGAWHLVNYQLYACSGSVEVNNVRWMCIPQLRSSALGRALLYYYYSHRSL